MISNNLEEQAAKAIGLILFEFTRLDMNLGLCVVWTNEGKNLEQLTSIFNEKSFNCRLNFIEKCSCKKYKKDSIELNKYESWIKDAHEIREIRNKLVHGRYGFIPEQGCVANVLGLPTSVDQSETRYTVKQLNNIVSRIKELGLRLSELRKEHPV